MSTGSHATFYGGGGVGLSSRPRVTCFSGGHKKCAMCIFIGRKGGQSHLSTDRHPLCHHQSCNIRRIDTGGVTFGSDRIRTYRGKDEKANPADSYRLSTPEHVPGRMKSRTEEGQDGRSRAGGSEHSEEPQRDTREKKVILVLR